jgi:hypothetical protein
MDEIIMVRVLGIVSILGFSIPGMTFGYLIAVKQKLDLLPGVNEFNFSNPNAYARSVGYSLFLLGLLSGITGIVWSAGIVTLTSVVAPFSILILMAIPCLVVIHRNSGRTTHDS